MKLDPQEGVQEPTVDKAPVSQFLEETVDVERLAPQRRIVVFCEKIVDVPVHEGRAEEFEARDMKDVLQERTVQVVKAEKDSETARGETF